MGTRLTLSQAVLALEEVVVVVVLVLAVLLAQYGLVEGQGAEAEVRMAWTGLCWRMGWAVVWPSCPWQLLRRQQPLQEYYNHCESIIIIARVL